MSKTRVEESRGLESREAGRSDRERNPFLDEVQSTLPYIPDTPEWSYMWMRHSIRGEADGGNLNMHLNGRLRYEYVRPEEMPNLSMFHHRDVGVASDLGVIRVNDVVLMKTSTKMRRMYLEACEIRASALGEMLRQRAYSVRDSQGRGGVKEYTDSESYGINE